MTTPRALRDALVNICDYLRDAELAIYTNSVMIQGTRVSFFSHDPARAFLLDDGDPSVDQYLAWVEAGAYSALLFDGSLLQMTYDVVGGKVAGHRLAFVPCPYDVEAAALTALPVLDVIEQKLNKDPFLRSPIRFDLDPAAAKPGHPAAHFTINSVDCRIACIAPMHPLRFLDFVFRNFYSPYWTAHKPLFEEGTSRHLERGNLDDDQIRVPHLMWNQDARPLVRAT